MQESDDSMQESDDSMQVSDESEVESDFHGEIVREEVPVFVLICFLLHYCICIYTIIPYFTYNSTVTFFVIVSWNMNDDFCVISQFEEFYFGITFIFQTKAKRVTNLQKTLIYIIQLYKIRNLI